MDNLLRDLKTIEMEHNSFFEKNNLKLSQYIIISKKPVMIRFNNRMDNKYRLPDEIMEKVNTLIMSYYS